MVDEKPETPHWVRITRQRIAVPGQKYAGRHVVRAVEAVQRNPDGVEIVIPISVRDLSTFYPIDGVVRANLEVAKIEEVLLEDEDG